jgi:hypothetical protein
MRCDPRACFAADITLAMTSKEFINEKRPSKFDDADRGTEARYSLLHYETARDHGRAHRLAICVGDAEEKGGGDNGY